MSAGLIAINNHAFNGCTNLTTIIGLEKCNLKNGINNSNTSFLIKEYKEYRIKSIEGLIKSISKSDLKYLEDVDRYNTLSEKVLEKILNKGLIEVTSLPIDTYI
jgi:hypothetical protein